MILPALQDIRPRTQGEQSGLLCRTPNLHGGWHTLYVLAKKDFDLDVLKIEE